MKYRDHKTGDVFENIEMAIWNDCRRRDACDADCALFDIRKSSACYDYVISHPTEAARLMGYEVVEDHAGDATKMIKEEPMEKKDKPRICQVLGVEVGEPFKIEGYNGEYHINDDGVLKWGGQTSDDAIYEAINHPDRIIRKACFTKDEVEAAIALINAGAHIVYRNNYGTLRWACNEFDDGSCNVLPSKLFPSVRVGQSIFLEEIIDGKL